LRTPSIRNGGTHQPRSLYIKEQAQKVCKTQRYTPIA
jgi:hypothetical protein